MTARAARTSVAVVAGLLIVAAGWRLLGGPRTAPGALLRAAPVLPAPSPPEKAAFFFEQMRRAGTIRLGGRELSAWRTIGQRALLDLGTVALDDLLSEKRLPDYFGAPDLLSNVLQLLARFPDADRHPRFHPFLLYWLDPDHCPPSLGGRRQRANWAEDFRLLVFAVYGRFPHPEILPACREELARPHGPGTRDLRPAAINLMLQLGETEPVRAAFAGLPPNEAEPRPETNLRMLVLDRVHMLAGRGRTAEQRATARRLESACNWALDRGDRAERILAQAALMRLGHEGMVERLLADFEELRDDEAEAPRAWAALAYLARDRADPRVRDICLEVLRAPDPPAAELVNAAELASLHWLGEPAVRDLIVRLLERKRLQPESVLPGLVRDDRAGAVAWLRRELESGDPARIQRAGGLAGRLAVKEAGPVLFDLARRATEAERPFLYRVLATLRVRGLVPLLRADLEGARSTALRDAAATELLALSSAEADRAVARAVDRLDRPALDAVLRAAQARGRAGVPEAAVGPVLRCLRELPGEEGRLTALLVLRCRGSLEGVREALIDAYRREPSRVVAAAIRETLVELAHR